MGIQKIILSTLSVLGVVLVIEVPTSSCQYTGGPGRGDSSFSMSSVSMAPTHTPTFTATQTPTFTPTSTHTSTPSPTSTFTPTFTPSFTPTSTPSFTPTSTPSFTPTFTPSFTPTLTHTAVPTFTTTPIFVPSFTPTNTSVVTVVPTIPLPVTDTILHTLTFFLEDKDNSVLEGALVYVTGIGSFKSGAGGKVEIQIPPEYVDSTIEISLVKTGYSIREISISTAATLDKKVLTLEKNGSVPDTCTKLDISDIRLDTDESFTRMYFIAQRQLSELLVRTEKRTSKRFDAESFLLSVLQNIQLQFTKYQTTSINHLPTSRVHCIRSANLCRPISYKQRVRRLKALNGRFSRTLLKSLYILSKNRIITRKYKRSHSSSIRLQRRLFLNRISRIKTTTCALLEDIER